jgi:hypothetical protein
VPCSSAIQAAPFDAARPSDGPAPSHRRWRRSARSPSRARGATPKEALRVDCLCRCTSSSYFCAGKHTSAPVRRNASSGLATRQLAVPRADPPVDAVGSVGHLRPRLLQAHERLDLKPGNLPRAVGAPRVSAAAPGCTPRGSTGVHLVSLGRGAAVVGHECASAQAAMRRSSGRPHRCTSQLRSLLHRRFSQGRQKYQRLPHDAQRRRATGLRGLLLRCRTVPIVLLIDAFRQQDGIRQLHAFSDCRSVRACGVWTRAAWE